MIKYRLKFLLLSICSPIFFFIGFYSDSIFNWNYDVYFSHSLLIITSTLFFILLDFVFRNAKTNKYIRLVNLNVLAASFLGVALAIIQNDLIDTRWLELGKFSINDSEDYVRQSLNYLFNNEVISKKGRVVYPILYAGLLGEFNLDTSIIQLLFTVLLAIITFFSAILIYRYFGYIYSLIFTGLSVDFLIEHVGGVCTETVGYILGATAFIFFFKLKLDKKKNINFLYMFAFFIFIGYLIRPSLPLVLPVLCVWSFFFIKRYKIKKSLNVIISVISIFFLVFFSNKLLIKNKAPNSPQEFGNVYDSWYATHELGKFFIDGNYKDLPPTLWTRIIEQNPKLNTLGFSEAVKLKKNIFIDSLLNNPENYIIGSILQIIKFYEVAQFYQEKYHNTAGFLHIEFFGYRALILLLFSLAGIISIYKYTTRKNLNTLFPGLLFMAVILSQPFIYGGEARTAAPIILFMNYIVVKLIFDTNKNLGINGRFFQNNSSILNQFCETKFYIVLVIIPFFTLFYFFICGLFNNYDFFKNDSKIEISCPKGYEPKEILFNSKSGFFLSSRNKKTLSKHYPFSDYYSYNANSAIIAFMYDSAITFNGLSKNELLKLDKFKFLTPVFTFTDTRQLARFKRKNSIFQTLGNQYLRDGGFFINPINKELGNKEGLVILKEEMVKEGLNSLYTCL